MMNKQTTSNRRIEFTQTILDDHEINNARCRILEKQIATLKSALSDIKSDVNQCHLINEKRKNKNDSLENQLNQENERLKDSTKRTEKLTSLQGQMNNYLSTLTKEKKIVRDKLDKSAYDNQIMRSLIFSRLEHKQRIESIRRSQSSRTLEVQNINDNDDDRRSTWLRRGAKSLRNIFSSADVVSDKLRRQSSMRKVSCQSMEEKKHLFDVLEEDSIKLARRMRKNAMVPKLVKLNANSA